MVDMSLVNMNNPIKTKYKNCCKTELFLNIKIHKEAPSLRGALAPTQSRKTPRYTYA